MSESKASRIRAHRLWSKYLATYEPRKENRFADTIKRDLDVTIVDILAAKRSKTSRRGPIPKLAKCELCGQPIGGYKHARYSGRHHRTKRA